MDVALTPKEKTTMIEKVHIVIKLSLSDKVPRQVSKEKMAADVLNKLVCT